MTLILSILSTILLGILILFCFVIIGASQSHRDRDSKNAKKAILVLSLCLTFALVTIWVLYSRI